MHPDARFGRRDVVAELRAALQRNDREHAACRREAQHLLFVFAALALFCIGAMSVTVAL